MVGRRNGRGGGKQRIQNVRVVDDYAGSDGVKMDRVLSELQNSHSQVRILAADSFTLSTGTTGGLPGSFTGITIRNTDDFASLRQQFETYRITMIRFDVYDINAAVPTVGYFSTFHDVTPNSSAITWTLASVLDGPDSQAVPPGSGKISLVWKATGTFENQFQSTSDAQAPVVDFGGLRYYLNAAATAAPKYLVAIKAVVDFRGRT